MNMRPTEVESAIRGFERIGNRIIIGAVLAAFIIGLAMIMASYHPSGWNQWAFFLVGFVFAEALGIYLAWSILRSMRR
jgi:hypothetical protein